VAGHFARSASLRLLRNTKQTARLLHSPAGGKAALPAYPKSLKVPSHRTTVAAIGAGSLSKSRQTSTDSAEDAPWLIVGLGNPGARYDGTRHNVRHCRTQHFASISAVSTPTICDPHSLVSQVGFQVLDTLASRLGVSVNRAQDKALQARGTIAGQQVVLAKPITFMNVSGEAVGKLTRYYKV